MTNTVKVFEYWRKAKLAELTVRERFHMKRIAVYARRAVSK